MMEKECATRRMRYITPAENLRWQDGRKVGWFLSHRSDFRMRPTFDVRGRGDRTGYGGRHENLLPACQLTSLTVQHR